MGDILLKEVIPAELHDRGYIKESGWLDKPVTDKEVLASVFKKLDGAESLLGKRPAIPGKDAKDEELDKFFGQFRPEKADDYEIPIAKDAKNVDEAFLKTVREAFHAGDINKRQAAKFLAKMTEFGAARQKEAQAAQEKAAKEFDALSKAALGGDNKAVMERARKLIAEHAPAVYKNLVPQLDDKSLLIMTGVLEGVVKAYGLEDKLNPKGSGSGDGGEGSREEKRERAKALIAEIDKMKPMDPNREKKQAEVNALYKEIAELTPA